MAHPEDEKGRGGVAGYAIAADGGGGDDDEESYITQLSALDRKEPSAPSGAELERLEGAAAVNKISPSDVFCIHAAEFGGGSSRDAVWGRPHPIFFPPRRSLLLRSCYSVSTFQLNLFTLRLSH